MYGEKVSKEELVSQYRELRRKKGLERRRKDLLLEDYTHDRYSKYLKDHKR